MERSNSTAKRLNSKHVALENEKRVLRALTRFGWLRTKDIALLCWSKWLPSGSVGFSIVHQIASSSSIRMAQVTLKRMYEKRLLLRTKAHDGATIYALAEGGVRTLNAYGINTSSGKDLIRNFSVSQYIHRCISNQIAIYSIIRGFKASTEREISVGKSIVGLNGFNSKRPDVLVKEKNSLIWIEVERSRKNSRDTAALSAWISALAVNNKIGNYCIKEVVFVCTKTFKNKMMKDLTKQSSIKYTFLENKFKFEDLIFT